MPKYTRCTLLSSSLATAAAVSVSSSAAAAKPQHRKGRIHQSVSSRCYPKIPLDQLYAFAVEIGLKGVDLLMPDDYQVPRPYGLRCTVGTCWQRTVRGTQRAKPLGEPRRD